MTISHSIMTQDLKLNAVILAGGKGTRLQTVVSDVPKSLAKINGRPFLDLLIEYLAATGIVNEVIMAIGYKANTIVERYSAKTTASLPILFSVEDSPLGTGGALLQAAQMTRGDALFLINGDTFLDANLRQLLSLHRKKNAAATLSLVHVPDVSRYGMVDWDPTTQQIRAFHEKTGSSGAGLINGGVCIISKRALAGYKIGNSYSFEKDMLPNSLKIGVFGQVELGKFVDIGTPESLAFAQKYLT